MVVIEIGGHFYTMLNITQDPQQRVSATSLLQSHHLLLELLTGNRGIVFFVTVCIFKAKTHVYPTHAAELTRGTLLILEP